MSLELWQFEKWSKIDKISQNAQKLLVQQKITILDCRNDICL